MALTGFPLLEEDLRRTVREAALDYESFQTPIRACDLRKCRGMCCHDGVFVGEEERKVIGEVFLEGTFSRQSRGGRGGSQSDGAGDFFEKRGRSWKTRTLAATEDELGVGFPEHFPKTRCVFLDENEHCGLQRQAMEAGKHPWFWKPFPCWLHPLGFRKEAGSSRSVLSLPTVGKDPARAEGYAGFASCTTCGKRDEVGEPAWKTLEPELAFLSEVSGRDLVGELASLL